MIHVQVMIWLELKVNSLMEALQSVENPEHCTLSHALNSMRPYLTKDCTQKLIKHLSSKQPPSTVDLHFSLYLVDEKELDSVENLTAKTSSKKRQVRLVSLNID